MKPISATDFVKEREVAYQRVFSQLPILTSLDTGWSGIHLVYDVLPGGEIQEVAAEQHGIAIHTNLTAPIQAKRKIDGESRQEHIQTGDIVITPARVSTSSHWYSSGSVIFLGFDPTDFTRAIEQNFDLSSVELIPHFATPDPLIYQIGLALKTVLETEGTSSRLYAEAMANALIVHLLQHYTARRPSLQQYAGGLAHHKRQQVIDYIQSHLERNLGLEELARVAQLSPQYFCEAFKRATNMTPHQFVIHSRIERAKELLSQSTLSIAEIARQVGFADQSHFHRHFKRLVGATPKQFQQQ